MGDFYDAQFLNGEFEAEGEALRAAMDARAEHRRSRPPTTGPRECRECGAGAYSQHERGCSKGEL